MFLENKKNLRGFGAVVKLQVSQEKILIGVFKDEETLKKNLDQIKELKPFTLEKINVWKDTEYIKYKTILDIKKIIKLSKRKRKK